VRIIPLVLLAGLALPVPARAQADPRAALNERDGFHLLEEGQARRAAEKFREALESDPRSARLHFGAGLAAFMERRDSEARRELEHAIDLDQTLKEARVVLGQVLRRLGDFAGAIRAYGALVAAHPDEREAADTLERWRRELELHDRMRHAVGERFTVSFEGPAEEALASRALESLDRAYWRIGSLLGATYPLDAVPVVLYTLEQFRDITRSPSWAAAAFDGFVRVPVGGALDKPEELDRVLAHEFTHALVRSLAPRGVPAWLNEGLASAVESEDTSWAETRLAAATTSIPIAELTTSFGRLSGDRAEIAYAESAIVVGRILAEAGGDAVAQLLRDLGAGADLDQAFRRRIQRPLDDFLARTDNP
jgi:hypothetical protein